MATNNSAFCRGVLIYSISNGVAPFSVVMRCSRLFFAIVVGVILLGFFIVVGSDDIDGSGDAGEGIAVAVVEILLCLFVGGPDDIDGSDEVKSHCQNFFMQNFLFLTK